MKSFLYGLFVSLMFLAYSAASECVILLHGLARTDKSMEKMSERLERVGYSVVNFYYPSRSYGIEYLAEKYLPKAFDQCNENSDINFVTHSMGGVLVRQYLNKRSVEKLRRVVMLGPPNKGSQVVDKLGNLPGFQWINGPAGLQLGTGKDSLPNQLGAAGFEVGVIAGSRSINPALSMMLPGMDDGKVTVENTKLEGMSGLITLPVTHTFMMKNDEVIRQTIHFLQTGRFDSERENSDIP